MDSPLQCTLATPLAARLREQRLELTRRWLDRISARVAIEPERVFPSDELLDHVPLLIDAIADYMENPAEEIASHMPVVGKAMELGALRYRQGFDAYEILKEYELLGGVLFSFLSRTVDEIEAPCTRGELLQCAHRVFRAVSLIQQVTTTQYLRSMGERIREREERLRGFNRMVSHELKNRVGAIRGAHDLLKEPWLEEDRRQRFIAMIGENAEAIQALLENLVSLSRLEDSVRQQHNVLFPRAAAEAARQLRELARARGVAVRMSELPNVEVNAAAVELCLTNYLSNAIKYSDPAKRERWVEIAGRVVAVDGSPQELVVEVRDNGLGVPSESQARLFQRFFRAHETTVTGIEGTGIGLSIVRETVESLGGRAWAEFRPEGGSIFAFALPCRRYEDRATELSEQESPAAVARTVP